MAITTRSWQRIRVARAPIRCLKEQPVAREKILIDEIAMLDAPGGCVELRADPLSFVQLSGRADPRAAIFGGLRG
jgi:hypothetical protein